MPHCPYHYLPSPFLLLFAHFTGLFICSFHLSRLSPGLLIYTAPTTPLGHTGLRHRSRCPLKAQCVHTDMKRSTKTEMPFWESTQRHKITAGKHKDTRRKENTQAPPSRCVSSKAEVPELCIWESDMLPWTTAWSYSGVCPFGKVEIWVD